jgi:hypothetical protein
MSEADRFVTNRFFFIIGAQKGGTTALFEYLRQHPDVYMPPEKEAGFFTEDDLTDTHWEKYRRRFLTSPQPVRVIGTASPQYMCDSGVPKRMATRVPDALLIAVLRDPIARAVSHYKMTCRRGDERRSFAQAVSDQLEPAALARIRTLSFRDAAEHDAYVAWGEYPRIIRRYLEHFPRQQLLILYSEDLRERREETLVRVYRHLGIAENYMPPNIERLYHRGGAKRKLPGLEKLMRSFAVRGLFRLATSKRKYKNMQLALERWNVKTGAVTITQATYTALAEHYASDIEVLANLCGEHPRWFKQLGEKSIRF